MEAPVCRAKAKKTVTIFRVSLLLRMRGVAQKAPISVISEAQERQSTAPEGLPAGTAEDALETGTAALAGLPTALGSAGEEDRRRGRRWLLLAALLLGATWRGATGLSRGRSLRMEGAPRLGSRLLRVGRIEPEALRMGAVLRAGMG